MAKKKLTHDGVLFAGKASDEVTGSQYYVRLGDNQCLLECGLHQAPSNDFLDSYNINFEKFKFNPTDLTYVFVCHAHIDHCGLLPRLVKQGFNGKIIMTSLTKAFFEPLLSNCCAILQEEAKILSKRYHRDYSPLYDENDVAKTLTLIESSDNFNSVVRLSDTLSFQWIPNSHCLGSAQLQLIYTDSIKTRKILYTSDLGKIVPDNHYVTGTQIPTEFNDIVLMESTYGASSRSSKKNRLYDLKLLKSAIETVIERKGSVILPCFSFSRTQELLTTLYDLFGKDKDFTVPVVIDSVLSVTICEEYGKMLQGENKERWSEVSEWKNVRYISDKADSKAMLSDPRPKIVLSSSGFCTNGRILGYLQRYLKDSNSMIIFSGYVGDNPSYLSYRIKNSKEFKRLKVNKLWIPNRADCLSLSTFSSHADSKDLIKFGSSLNTNKIVLVHGEKEAKEELAKKLGEEASKKLKTFKVSCSYQGMIISL